MYEQKKKNRTIVYKKRCWLMLAAVLILLSLVLLWNHRSEGRSRVREEQDLAKAFQRAADAPTEPYPELVTYTLAKMTGENNSFMPKGDTFENNAYTRYLKKKLNVQNEDVIEITEDDNYDLFVQHLIAEGKMPDVVLLSDLNLLERLVENDLAADLTEVYEYCTSDRIKEIYGSYGEGLLESVTFDGRLMALPSTQVYAGCNLFWVREDWRVKLGLSEPQTLQDVEDIVLAFKENQMGGSDNIGLACLANLAGQESSNYSMDPVFGAFHAYPQIWVKNEAGELEYGSLSQETRNALEYLNGWYEKGVLDEDYMMRTTTEIGKLVKRGQCGAFFGWWWAPNNPLLAAMDGNSDMVWKPYLITDEDGKVNSYISSQSTRYVVVRKDYEHPEIIMKIITALFDDARFQDDSTQEMDQYQLDGIDITARPLVINCDYSDAVFRTTKNIRAVLDGIMEKSELSTLESVYYDACSQYLSGGESVDLWASYESRLEAVELIAGGDLNYINQEYVHESNQTVSQDMRDMEILDFMKIITGEEPITYFDEFVKAWKRNMFLENVS